MTAALLLMAAEGLAGAEDGETGVAAVVVVVVVPVVRSLTAGAMAGATPGTGVPGAGEAEGCSGFLAISAFIFPHPGRESVTNGSIRA